MSCMASARGIRHSRRVPSRTTKLVFAAGFVVVIALAIGLLRLTREATQVGSRPPEAHAPTSAPPAPAASPVAEQPAPSAPPIAAREHLAAGSAPRGHLATPELAGAPVSLHQELKRDENGHLVPIIPLRELQAQLPLAGAAMKACLERSGQRPTGTAMLSFTVAAKGTKLVIDTTGVQDEETLAGNPELLECMHRTANALVLDGYAVPELGTPIYVRRRVRLDNGVLAEDSLPSFSYNP